jgi:hypothetical protein
LVSSEYRCDHLHYSRCRIEKLSKENEKMSSVTSSWRERRLVARTRRAIDRALAGTSSSPAMREELLTLAAGAQFRHLPR